MSAPNGNGRNKWSHKEAATEFHARHNHAPYSMAFNARLEAEARNPALDPVHRFMSGGTRLSFGNLSDIIVGCKPPKKDGDPPQLAWNQKQLAEWMVIGESALSDAITEAQELGFCARTSGGIVMYDNCLQALKYEAVNPLESVNGFGADSDSQNSDSPYLRFEKEYLAANSALAAAVAEKDEVIEYHTSEAQREREKKRLMKRPILTAWRDKLRREQKEKVDADSDSTNRTQDADSDSTMDAILDSEPAIPGVRTENAENPNVLAPNSDALLNPTGVKVQAQASHGNTSSSSSPTSTTTTTEPPLRAQDHPELHEGHDAIAEEVLERESRTRPIRIDPELSAIAQVAEALQSDEEAAKTLISRCRERVPDIESAEISEHVSMKRAQLAGRKGIGNLVGLLLSGVPKMITPAAIASYRARSRAAAEEEDAQRRRAEERRRQMCIELGLDPETGEPLDSS